MVPIIQIPEPRQLLQCIGSYMSAFNNHFPVPRISARSILLPHCTSTAPARPLSEHDTNVLSDITHSISEVATLARDPRGKTKLQEWLGEDVGRAIEEFWLDEWYCE